MVIAVVLGVVVAATAPSPGQDAPHRDPLPASGETGKGASTATPTTTAIPAAIAGRPAVRTVSLDDALRELDAQNLTLVQARSRAEQARAVVREARAPVLPTLTATGSYARNSDQARVAIADLVRALNPAAPTQGLPPPLVIQPLEAWTGAAALRVPILAPSAWFDLSAAGQAAEASAASEDTARLQIRSAFVQAAWLAAMGEEVVAASERAVETARDQERTSRRAVSAGTAAPLSILQAQTETTRRQGDLVRARSDQDRAELALGVFLGRADPVRVVLPASAVPASLDADALAAEALARRPELRAQEAQVLAADRQLASARWRYAPQLSATGSAFASDVPYPTGKKEGWRVTVDLTWPLYDGGFRYGKADEAAAALSGAEAARQQQRLEVAQQVKDAARDVAVARERLALAERQRAFAAEAAASARRGFEAGVAGSIDVLDANDRLYQAEVGLASTRAQLGVALAALERAVGR